MAQPALAMAGWAASLASLAATRRVSNVKHSDQSHIRVSPPRQGPGCRIRMPSAGRFPLIRSGDSRIARGPRGLCIAKSRVVPAPSAAARDARVYVEADGCPPGTAFMRALPRCSRSIRRARGRRRPSPCWPRRSAPSAPPFSSSIERRTYRPSRARPRESPHPRFSPP